MCSGFIEEIYEKVITFLSYETSLEYDEFPVILSISEESNIIQMLHFVLHDGQKGISQVYTEISVQDVRGNTSVKEAGLRTGGPIHCSASVKPAELRTGSG